MTQTNQKLVGHINMLRLLNHSKKYVAINTRINHEVTRQSVSLSVSMSAHPLVSVTGIFYGPLGKSVSVRFPRSTFNRRLLNSRPVGLFRAAS